MNLINTLYPNGRYIISMTHPHFHPEKEEYKKARSRLFGFEVGLQTIVLMLLKR